MEGILPWSIKATFVVIVTREIIAASGFSIAA